MPKSPREIISTALQTCIKFHEEAEYESAEVVLRQTLRAFQQSYYTEKDEIAQEHHEKGMYALASREMEKALTHFSKAYELKPDLRSAFINLIYCYFELKKFKNMWELYEDRTIHFDQLIAYKKIFDPKKKWNGKDSLEGKKVAVFCEQGLGDQINFSRYLVAVVFLPDAFHSPRSLSQSFIRWFFLKYAPAGGNSRGRIVISHCST